MTLKKIVNALIRLPNFIKAFGIIHGIRLFYTTLLRPFKPKEYSFKVPQYDSAITLRNSLSDYSIFWQCIVNRQYDLSDMKQYEAILKKYNNTIDCGDTPLIIDCGGNIGLSSIYFAKMFPKAQIIVLEPEKNNFSILLKNIEGYKNIKALQAAIWSHEDKLYISNPDAGSASFEVKESTNISNKQIRGISVNSLTEGKEILLMKIDIEGSQKELFIKNTQWVNKTDLIILELEDWKYPWQGTSQPFFKCLSQLNYDYIIKGENIFCFKNNTHQ